MYTTASISICGYAETGTGQCYLYTMMWVSCIVLRCGMLRSLPYWEGHPSKAWICYDTPWIVVNLPAISFVKLPRKFEEQESRSPSSSYLCLFSFHHCWKCSTNHGPWSTWMMFPKLLFQSVLDLDRYSECSRHAMVRTWGWAWEKRGRSPRGCKPWESAVVVDLVSCLLVWSEGLVWLKCLLSSRDMLICRNSAISVCSVRWSAQGRFFRALSWWQTTFRHR